MNRFHLGLAIAAASTLLAACQPPRGDPPVAIDPVPAPQLGAHAPSVRAAVERAQEAAARAEAQPMASAERATAQGELAMTCHAHDLAACADAAYRNAARLAPRDTRWPYLCGHLHADAARLDEAAAAFQAALAIDPDDAPAQFSLGEIQLKRGDAAAAGALFERLLGRPDARAAAHAGLGKAALAQRDYRGAIAHLQQALQLAPSAHRLRHPLATAWRAVGDERQAAEALQGYTPRGVEPTPPDPAVNAMAAHVASPQGLLRRGQRLAAAGRFDAALAAFEAGARAEPGNLELQGNLGVTLANLGRVDEARRVLAPMLERAPPALGALAHATLGALADRAGRDAEAAAHYEAALALDAHTDDARLLLADARMRLGRAADAAALYAEAARRAPAGRAHMSLALALVRLGRHGAAQEALERGLALQPDSLALNNAIARLLAAAPQAGLRDGPRALAISSALLERTGHPDVVQTHAMALAATGDFDQAARVQQQVVDAQARAAATTAASTPTATAATPRPFAETLLARYRARRAADRPWSDDDPIFQPRSAVVAVGR